MKFGYTFLLLSICAMNLFSLKAQTSSTPRFSKIPIQNTGCAAYFPGPVGEISMSYSEDSSEVYTAETEDTYYNGQKFGLILVRFNPQYSIPTSNDYLLISYMDYLKSTLNVKSSAGYGKGHTLSTHPSAVGVLDYWEDETKTQWVVKGWTADGFLCIMFIYGAESIENINVQEVFFNGFRFPGD